MQADRNPDQTAHLPGGMVPLRGFPPSDNSSSLTQSRQLRSGTGPRQLVAAETRSLAEIREGSPVRPGMGPMQLSCCSTARSRRARAGDQTRHADRDRSTECRTATGSSTVGKREDASMGRMARSAGCGRRPSSRSSRTLAKMAARNAATSKPARQQVQLRTRAGNSPPNGSTPSHSAMGVSPAPVERRGPPELRLRRQQVRAVDDEAAVGVGVGDDDAVLSRWGARRSLRRRRADSRRALEQSAVSDGEQVEFDACASRSRSVWRGTMLWRSSAIR